MKQRIDNVVTLMKQFPTGQYTASNGIVIKLNSNWTALSFHTEDLHTHITDELINDAIEEAYRA